MLYLECHSGISGDMTVAALLELGADREKLVRTLESLQVDGYRLNFERRVRCGIEAGGFDVILDGDEDGGSHDDNGWQAHAHGHAHEHLHAHEYDHGHEHEHEHDHGHEHNHEHDHNHEHGHDHVHEHRNLGDITAIIMQSDMTPRAKETALRIFGIVAQAEAKVHAKPVSEVHFHEVGAVDSIVDICAAAICLDDLDITECVVSELYEGSGHVRCMHGVLPVPVPAVTEIAREHGLYLHLTDTPGEMVTPTGAAIAAGIRTAEALPEQYRIVRIGMGAGKKEFRRANLLRAFLLEEKKPEEALQILETNIDDTTGEALGFVMDRLLAAGARDVCYIPAYMKKNRPAWLMKVVCTERVREELEAIIFRHTTTIGIRRYPISRTELTRRSEEVDTPLGRARIKRVWHREQEYIYPEYEDAARLAKESGTSFQEIYEMIRSCAGTETERKA